MIERLLHVLGVIVVLVFINMIIGPYLYHLEASRVITESMYCLILWSLNAAVTIGVAVRIFSIGKNTAGVKEISVMIIVNALLDIYRIYQFPQTTFLTGVFSMFSAVFIGAYGFVIFKRIIYKKKTGLYFLLLGPIYFIRFPFLVDLLLAYTTATINFRDRPIFYLEWTIYFNYYVVFIQLLVLNAFLKEKQTLKYFRSECA